MNNMKNEGEENLHLLVFGELNLFKTTLFVLNLNKLLMEKHLHPMGVESRLPRL